MGSKFKRGFNLTTSGFLTPKESAVLGEITVSTTVGYYRDGILMALLCDECFSKTLYSQVKDFKIIKLGGRDRFRCSEFDCMCNATKAVELKYITMTQLLKHLR